MLFANPQLAMWAFFLSVIPLIIVYLLRPKTKDIVIPSVMFIAQIDQKKKKYARIFNRIIKDPLFLIQLLVLIFLILAISAPYIIESKEIGGGHTVIIIDASASMQAGDRFDDAIDRAGRYLTARNSIILAENIPVLALRGGSMDDARNVLDNIPKTATTSDLYQAITLGSTLLTDGGGRIIVISDFTNWDGEDPYVAKKLAEADGIDVSFAQVSGGRNDLAITGGWLSRGIETPDLSRGTEYTCIIKNYMDSDVDATVEVLYNDERSEYDLRVGAHASEYFALKDIGAGVTEITLHPDDDLIADNHAYIVVPFRQTRRVLYISDHENSPSATALKLMPYTDVVFEKQDEVRSINVRNYDLAIVGLCNESLRSSLCVDLADYAAAGGSVVVMAQDGLLISDTGRLLPIKLAAKANETTLEKSHEGIMRDIDVTDIDIGHHLTGEAKRGSVTWVSTEGGTPVISYWRIGRGKVVYFGIPDIRGDDAWSDFHTKPEYPIFWLNLIDHLCGAGNIEDCNMQTGSSIRFDSRIRVTTPDGGVIRTDTLLLDQTGVYRTPDRLIAANLYNARESNLMDVGITVTETPKTEETEKMVRTTAKKEFDWYLLIIALILIFSELYYIHRRGEL